ncbi:MAG TPA: hypothetical protein PK874_12410 [Desulfobacteraceae bacterium]|nr:hypothetical protein [Desulfobacteraceae bacterium]
MIRAKKLSGGPGITGRIPPMRPVNAKANPNILSINIKTVYIGWDLQLIFIRRLNRLVLQSSICQRQTSICQPANQPKAGKRLVKGSQVSPKLGEE